MMEIDLKLGNRPEVDKGGEYLWGGYLKKEQRESSGLRDGLF